MGPVEACLCCWNSNLDRTHSKTIGYIKRAIDPILLLAVSWTDFPRKSNAFKYNGDMLHRHLVHQNFSLAAIDDVISRGKRQDWAALRQAVLEDQDLAEKVLRVCRAHVADPYAQRYHFWKTYVERQLT